jgi:hypothetical protein
LNGRPAWRNRASTSLHFGPLDGARGSSRPAQQQVQQVVVGQLSNT